MSVSLTTKWHLFGIVFNPLDWIQTLLKKSLWYRCFPVSFAKFLRTPFLDFFLTAAIFRLFLLKKMKFWDNSLKFYYFDEKTSPRSHLPHLSKLANLFLKDMSKFRANNHSWFVLILLSGSKKKMISDMKTTDFLGWKMPKE